MQLFCALLAFAGILWVQAEDAQSQQECVESCKSSGKTQECERTCVVLTPFERRLSAPLDEECVLKCNGEVTRENPLKPECEQKCVYQGKGSASVRRQRQTGNQARRQSAAEPGCEKACTTSEDGKTTECHIKCSGKMPGFGRVSGPLDRACVEQCNGGPVSDLKDLKPECEQKCAFKAGPVVSSKRTEFGKLEDCLKYCLERGLGHSEEQCKAQCKQTANYVVQG